MTDEGHPQASASQQSIGGLLDEVCDRFEAACKSATRPQIEDFLRDVPPSSGDRGFRELLELELAYRRRAGESPSADEYRRRFPQHTATIDELLSPVITMPVVATASAETIPAHLAESFSDVVPAPSQNSTAAATGKTVGTTTSSGLRFRVVRKHARGGLGEVFIAEDQELHREVALKQIQSQFADDVDSRTRFVLEAEVTGALEHPGIVPVYGLGTYADGRPFYAMRFIHGDSLKDAIDAYHDIDMGPRDPGARELELRKLLNRFVDVCDAIEYAHSRGIVHRDLKPGNIMLGNFGETLVVDWGLAKQINSPEPAAEAKPSEPQSKPMLLSGTAATRMGSAIGTPQYMSPEQAAGRLDLIGPRSDVYSLGATLYCLLTGKSPLSDRPSFDLEGILYRVCQGEIPPARAVHAAVPKGLEAICQKAMALRPEDRYASARELADDIEHWLADEPISALPDSRTQVVARWGRRHRSLAMATGIALVLITLISITAMVLIDHQRKIADRGFREARAAVDDLFTKVSEDTLLNQPGMQGLRKELLNKTLDYYNRFLKERGDESSISDELGITYFRVGRIMELVDTPTASLPYYEQAEAIQKKLLDRSPNDLPRVVAIADTDNAIGGALLASKSFQDAKEKLTNVVSLRQQMVSASPHNLEYARELANSIMNLGVALNGLHEDVKARDEFENAQKIRRGHLNDQGDTSKLQRDFAKGSYNLGNEELRLNHLPAAVDDFNQASALWRTLVQRDRRDLNLRFQLAICDRMIGDCEFRWHPDLALPSYVQALEMLKDLAEHNPDVSEYRAALAGVYMNMAAVQPAAESLASFDQARLILQGLDKRFPDNLAFRHDLALALKGLADRQLAAGSIADAKANYEEALSLLTELNLADPNDKLISQNFDAVRAAMLRLDSQKSAPSRSPSAPQISPSLPSQRKS